MCYLRLHTSKPRVQILPFKPVLSKVFTFSLKGITIHSTSHQGQNPCVHGFSSFPVSHNQALQNPVGSAFETDLSSKSSLLLTPPILLYRNTSYHLLLLSCSSRVSELSLSLPFLLPWSLVFIQQLQWFFELHWPFGRL